MNNRLMLRRVQQAINPFQDSTLAYDLLDLGLSATNVIRVRRTGGATPTEADFTTTEIIDGTLASWVGVSNDGFVTILYNQKGTNNFIQTTSSSQPKIVSNGVLETENGNPTIIFDGVDDYMETEFTVANNQPYLLNIIAKYITSSNFSYIYGQESDGTDVRIQQQSINTNRVRVFSGMEEDVTLTSILDQNLYAILFNGASSNVNINDVDNIANVGTDNGIGKLVIGARFNATFNGNISFQHFSIFNQNTINTDVINKLNSDYNIF